MTPHAKGLLIATLGVLILSPDALLNRLVGVDVWTVLFWRGIGQILVLGGLAVATEGTRIVGRARALGPIGLAAGLSFACSQVAFVTSVRLTSPANVLVLVSAAPLCAALFSRLLLRERLSRATALAIAGGMIGVAITVSDAAATGTWQGDLIAAGVPTALGFSYTLLRRAPSVDTRLVLVVTGVAIMVVSLTFGGAPTLPAGLDILWLGLLGFAVTPLSFLLISRGLRYLPAAEVGLLMLLELVFGALWVWLALGEAPSDRALIGGGLVLTTLVAHSVWSLHRQSRMARVSA